MAKLFAERLATALQTDRSNCKTLRELISETQAELERQQAIQRSAEAESVDVTLNDCDRDEAAGVANRAGRLAKGYVEALEKLQANLAAKQDSDRRRRECEERAAAEAERDELAAEFRVEVPQLVERLTGLFAKLEANEARLRAAGAHGRDAEAEARDIPGNYFDRAGPIDRFTKMKIPAWGGAGRAWPPDPGAQQRARVAEQERQQRLRYERTKTPEARQAAARARARDEAKWTPCRVVHHLNALIGDIGHRRGRSSLDCDEEMVFEMNAQQIEAARAKGLTVEPVSARAEAE